MNSRKIFFWVYNVSALLLYWLYQWLDFVSILQYQPDPGAVAIGIPLLVEMVLIPVFALLILNILYTRLFLKEWSVKRVLIISLIELVIGVPLFAFLSGLILFLLLGA